MLPKLILYTLYLTLFGTFCLILMQLLSVISTIDDLNYPEKTDTYYVVNAPYVFSACWKVCVYLRVSKSLFASCATKSLMLEPLVGCKASCARKDKAENPGSSGLWER